MKYQFLSRFQARKPFAKIFRTSLGHKASFLIATLSLSVNAYSAVDCDTSSLVSQSGWSIATNLDTMHNGSVIATNNFFYDITARNISSVPLSVKFMNENVTDQYDGLPLTSLPGVSLRWSWQGYVNLYKADLSPAAPAARNLSGPTGTFAPLFDSMLSLSEVSEKRFRLQWRIELVISDIEKYVGGRGDMSKESNLRAMRAYAAVDQWTCGSPVVVVDLELLPGGLLAIPELPKLPAPTCNFPINV